MERSSDINGINNSKSKDRNILPRLSIPALSVNKLVQSPIFFEPGVVSGIGKAHEILHAVFVDVYQDPEWAERLNVDFNDLVHCEKTIKRDGKGKGSLLECINDCVKTANWEPLFIHSILRPTPKLLNLGKFSKLRAIAIAKTFQCGYLGDNHELILKAIDEIKEKERYASILPVVQSSGMGKSKTMYRIAQDRIVIPICLRHDDVEGSISYPLPDALIRQHILSAPSAKKETKCVAFLRAFLDSVFRTTRDLLQDISDRVSYTDLAEAFLYFFDDDDKRDGYYKHVISTSTSYVSEQELLATWQELEATLKRVCTSFPSGYPIIIAIDEIHVLNDKGERGDTLYTHLKSVLSKLAQQNFCTVVLSTDASICTPAPSLHDTAPLIAPFTELPFDVYVVGDPLASGQHDLASVGSFEFAVKFGRPLWYSTYLSHFKHDPNPDIAFKVMELAEQKLSGFTWPPCEFGTSTIALLSARLSLDLSRSIFESLVYERELVRRHLRVLYSMHNGLFWAGSSSEPIIAEAAAMIINNPDYKIDVWKLLAKFVNEGLAIQGTVGTLVGRTLSTLAMDCAIKELKAHSELKYQTPVPVNSYYKALLTTAAWKALRTSVPANRDMITAEHATRTFEEAFKDAYFHFSHYAKAADAGVFNKRYTWAFWLRGTAALWPLNGEIADRSLPIFFSDHGTVSRDSVSCALEQDRTTTPVADPRMIGIQSAEALNLFDGATTLPYIATVHRYSLVTDEHIVTVHDPTETRTPGTPLSENAEAPRYQIIINGLESYRLLDKEAKEHIHEMINDSDFFLFKQRRPLYV